MEMEQSFGEYHFLGRALGRDPMTFCATFEMPRSEGVLDAESRVQPLPDQTGRDAGKSAPFGNRESSAKMLNESRFARVVRLLLSGGPSAVPGLIVPVVVDAVQFKSIRRPHVGKERTEIVLPSVAHGDPTAAVGSPKWSIRVKAPRFSSAPDSVFSRVAHSVSRGIGLGLFALPTPATVDHSAVEVPGEDVFDGAAVASASPSACASRSVDVSGNLKSPETLSMKIIRDRSCHGSSITQVAV